jgi:epoxyqueuosine reductase
LTHEERTDWVVDQARALGFDLCGVAPVEDFSELERLPEWLGREYSGEMRYLEDERRRSPARVLEGAQSLIVCALNYNTPLPYSTEVPPENGEQAAADHRGSKGPRGWISRYAWGDDYHDVMRGRLEALVAALPERFGEPFQARTYVDTGPVVERVVAKYAGLGWLAKNTCLINQQLGSWLFLGVIVTTLELAPSLGAIHSGVNEPPPDLCGNCRLCIDACPTGAIVEPYVLDARRCISYLTIELRGAIPVELRQGMGRMVFGCDICQDVCPWNRTAPATNLAAFLPRQVIAKDETQKPKFETRPSVAPNNQDSLFAPQLERLASLCEEEFREVFRGSAIRRTKWRGLVRNACVALGNSSMRPGTAEYSRNVAQLERLAGSDDAVVAEHARWALGRLHSP